MRNKKERINPISDKQLKASVLKNDNTIHHRWYFALLLFFILIIYLPSLKYVYVFDDALFITKNASVQKGISGIGEIFTHSATFGFNKENEGSYRPISLALFAVIQQFFPNNPLPGHLLNILCYGIVVLLLFSLLKKLLTNYSINFIFSVSLLFTVHPLHTEVVANIKSLDEILALLFLLLSGLMLTRNSENSSIKNYCLSGIFFFLALLSKESAITFLPIIPIMYYFFKQSNLKKTFSLFILFTIPVLAYLLLRVSVLDFIGTKTTPDIIDNIMVTAKNFNEKTATSIYILGQYAKLIFLPFPLSIDYSYNQIPIINWSDSKAIISGIILLAAFIAGLILFFRKKLSGAAILFFFLSISIVSHLFVDIRATMAERFLFTPSIAACILIPLGLHQLIKYLFKGNEIHHFSKLGYYLSIFIVILFTSLSIARVPVWKNDLALFESGVHSSPKSARVYFLLGNLYLEKADKETNETVRNEYIQKSIANLKQCIAIHPEFILALEDLGHAHYFLRDLPLAIKYLKSAYTINPKYLTTTFFLSVCYENSGMRDSAFIYNSRALEIDSLYNPALNQQGFLLYSFGDNETDSLKKTEYYRKSLIAIEKAIQNDPKNSENYLSKGLVLTKQGNYTDALPVLKIALELKPDDAGTLKLLGSVYGLIGNAKETVIFLNKFLELHNPDPDVYCNLSLAYIKQNDFKNASETLNKGLSLFPGEPRLIQLRLSLPSN